MLPNAIALPRAIRQDVVTLWDYHNLHQELRPCDVGIGLGSHDPSVATVAAALYRDGLFPLLVFSGANAPTTRQRFPRGEAVHYREAALRLGVPPDAIRVEARATNTMENLLFTRDLLSEEGLDPKTVLLVSRPSQQRRAHATCRMVWPEVRPVGASTPVSLDEYIASIGDLEFVVSTLVGDTQRVAEYGARGFMAPQHIPGDVRAAYERLVQAGFTTRLIC